MRSFSETTTYIIAYLKYRHYLKSEVYNKTEVFTKNEITALLANVGNKVWKGNVANFAAIATTYPVPEEGWTVSTNDTNAVYRYDFESRKWLQIDANGLPFASAVLSGKMSSSDFIKLRDLPSSSALTALFALKESSLGKPTKDGYILSSTVAGVRSWIKMAGGHIIQAGSNTYPQRENLKLVGLDVEDDPVNNATIIYASPSALVKDITQVGHNFNIGEWIVRLPARFALGKADLEATSDIVGMVVEIVSPDIFRVAISGHVSGLVGLVDGTTYFLSDVVPGRIFDSPPTLAGHVNKPVFVADSSTSGYVINYRGIVVSALNSSPLVYAKDLEVLDVQPTLINFSDGINVTQVGNALTLEVPVVDSYTKTEADSRLALKLNLAGGTMTGAVDFNNNTIKNYCDVVYQGGNVQGDRQLFLNNGAMQKFTQNGVTTFAMPPAVSGASLTLIVFSNTYSLYFAGVSTWIGTTGKAVAPVFAKTTGCVNLLTFFSESGVWYGMLSGTAI